MQNKFNKSEIEFIQRLSEKSITTSPYYDTFRTQLKVHKICTRLGVCSIEEVIRKVLYYNWFELNISDDYRNYVYSAARKYITVKRLVRNQMLEFGKNVSQSFGELCTHCACLNEEKLKDRAEYLTKSVKDDKENQRLFSSISSFRDLISNKYNFQTLFDSIFRIDDDYMEDINIAEQLLQSASAKYLMRVRLCIEEAFPLKTKRELTNEEKEFVRFLLYKGDEIDYMEQYSLSVKDFEEKLDTVLEIYGVIDIQELLICASVEESFKESSLLYESFFLNLKASLMLKNKENMLLKANDKDKESMQSLFTELEKHTVVKFLEKDSMTCVNNALKDIRDCDFTTIGKSDEFKKWYEDNVQSLSDTLHLKECLIRIDNFTNL